MLGANSKKLVAALKRKREADGLSIRALAEKIGVSFSSLARVERGEGEPDNNSTIRILNWLGDEAKRLGLSYRDTALVHFRAAKNVSSKTVHCLLQAADAIKQGAPESSSAESEDDEDSYESAAPVASLSKNEMEVMARRLRDELKVGRKAPLDALSVRIDGVDVRVPSEVEGLSRACVSYLTEIGRDEWSAMSVPLDPENTKWVVLRNDNHPVERQRVTYLEECWHILLGHKLTKIARVADSYGRTYDANEEHDAYFLAAASLLPRPAIVDAVNARQPAKEVARQYGVSPELVEYRIKRLHLWGIYKGISVGLGSVALKE